MTSSTSSSGRRLRVGVGAAVALAAAALACAGAPRVRAPGSMRVLLLPVYNLSGGRAPGKELLAPIATGLARAGLDVVEGEPVEDFLSRHRMRHVGGIDGAAAKAARDELGVDAVVVTTIQYYAPASPPKLALTMRLVSADENPVILWMDGTFRSGDDSPGLLGLGRIGSMEKLQDKALSDLTRSLADASRRGFPSVPPCESEPRFRPVVAYGSPRLDPNATYSVAVLPFVDHTARRGAGEEVALEFVRQLASVPGLRVLEPGVVRERLIRYRIIAEGGASRETARMLRGSLESDLIVAGSVLAFQDAGGAGVPIVEFDALLLETHTSEVIWESASKAKGDDGVHYAKIGAVNTASDLTCRMARSVADGIVHGVRAGPRVPADARLAPVGKPVEPLR